MTPGLDLSASYVSTIAKCELGTDSCTLRPLLYRSTVRIFDLTNLPNFMC